MREGCSSVEFYVDPISTLRVVRDGVKEEIWW